MRLLIALLILSVSIVACSSDDDSTDNLQEQQNIIPAACFEITDTNYLTLSFNSDCSENAVDYEWDFGDGETTINKNPSHTYKEEGFYTITLKVSSNTGNIDRTEKNISVSEKQICTECKCQIDPDLPPMTEMRCGTEAEVIAFEAMYSIEGCFEGSFIGCERL